MGFLDRLFSPERTLTPGLEGHLYSDANALADRLNATSAPANTGKVGGYSNKRTQPNPLDYPDSPAVRPGSRGFVTSIGVGDSLSNILADPDQNLDYFLCHAPDCVFDELTITNTGANVEKDPGYSQHWIVEVVQIDAAGGRNSITKTRPVNIYKTSSQDSLSMPILANERYATLDGAFIAPRLPLFVNIMMRGDTTPIASLVADVFVQVTVRLRLLFTR